jgi:alpha-ketoglutarate-dependent taurine dioxygenase
VRATIGWLKNNQVALFDALRVYGALYIVGAGVNGIGAFALIRDALFRERARYEQRATPRTDFGDDVFSSTDFPAAGTIKPHNENSYALRFPGVLLFGCLKAPITGGATNVVDVRNVLQAIPSELSERFRKVGWTLRRVYHAGVGMPWQKAFETESRKDVETYCQENAIDWEWLDGDTLATTQRRPAIISHPVTGQEVWFNHVAFWSEWSLDRDLHDVLLERFGQSRLPFNTMFGDGSALIPADVASVSAAYEKHLVRERWRAGDLLLVDNVAAAHGREPFKGPRQIVVAMGDPVTLTECVTARSSGS